MTDPKIVIKSEERRLVYGEVYAPMRVDTDGESMAADDIEAMAHDFLAKGLSDRIDVQHDFEESGAVVVESFIARKNDPDGFVIGSWVLGVRIPENLWVAVKSGEINGFSFAGRPKGRVRSKAVVLRTKMLSGETEKSSDESPLPPHFHLVELTFDHSGRIVPTETSEEMGHRHSVHKATATGREFDHSHRMILIENE